MFMGINLSQSDNGVARLHQRSRVRRRDSLTDSVPKNVRGYVVVFIGDLKILKTFINLSEKNMFVLHVNLSRLHGSNSLLSVLNYVQLWQLPLHRDIFWLNWMAQFFFKVWIHFHIFTSQLFLVSGCFWKEFNIFDERNLFLSHM